MPFAVTASDMSRHGPSHCSACKGGPCKGGGNRRCVQRYRRPSILAGILDTYGGLRFIVTYRKHLKYHVRHDEIAVIVPNLLVHEPIAWDDIPIVVARIELEVDKQISERGTPNDPVQREIVTMRKLRCLEHQDARRSLNLDAIAFT